MYEHSLQSTSPCDAMMKTKHYHDIATDAGPLIITSLFLEAVLAQKTA